MMFTCASFDNAWLVSSSIQAGVWELCLKKSINTSINTSLLVCVIKPHVPRILLDWGHCPGKQEVTGDDTLALQSVLESDEKREGLLREEKEINAQMAEG